MKEPSTWVTTILRQSQDSAGERDLGFTELNVI